MSIEIRDVGPVHSLMLPIPEDGGIVVLTGRNGSGKSHVLGAVQSLVSGGDPPPVRDGQPHAVVKGFGATLKVAKRASRSGQLEVQTLVGDVDPATLVDPGIADEERADAARIKALLTLSRAQATSQTFMVMDGLVPDFPEKETDPVKLCAIATRWYQSQARDAESSVAESERKALAYPVVDVDYDGTTDLDVLTDELSSAKAHLEGLGRRARECAEQQRGIREAEEKLKQVGGNIDGRLAIAKSTFDCADAECKRADKNVVQIEGMLATAKAERDKAAVKLSEAARTLGAIQQELRQVEELRLAITPVNPIEPVVEGDILAANEAIEVARKNIELATLVVHKRINDEKRNNAQAAAEFFQQRAQGLRDAAMKCESKLSEMVEALRTGLFVKEGRLRIPTDRGPDELFADLSHGERWKVAINVCVESCGEHALIVIPQEAWEGLDPHAQHDLANHVRDRKAVVITAECGSGPLESILR